MTIQRLIFELKEHGASDIAVRVAVGVFLHDRGYKVTSLTYIVIEKYLKLYKQFNQEVV